MQKVKAEKLINKYGARETSKMLGLNHTTVWRWIKEGKEVVVEMEKGVPIAYTVRKVLN